MNKKLILAYSAIVLIAVAMVVTLVVHFVRLGTVPEYTFESTSLSMPAFEEASSGSEAMYSEGIVGRNRAALTSSLTIPDEAVMIYISPDGREESVRKTLELVKDISDEICKGIDDDYEKLFAISQWVSKNIYYDFDARDSSVTEENIALSYVLETHRTVCLGFSNLYAALCHAQGIDCRIAHGTAVAEGTFKSNGGGGELHEWNVAIIDGRAVWVDSLWDTSNSYYNGIYHEGKQTAKYFDISEATLAKDHCVDRVDIRNYFSVTD